MKQINTGKAELLLVKLPEDAYDLDIKQMSAFFNCDYILNYKTPHRWNNYQKRNYDWGTRSCEQIKILGNPWELTEEQCLEIMPLIDRVYGSSYIDYGTTYKNLSHGYTGSAKESFNSLLRKNKIYRENPYGNYSQAIIDKVSYSDWEEAEALTGNCIMLIKVK